VRALVPVPVGVAAIAVMLLFYYRIIRVTTEGAVILSWAGAVILAAVVVFCALAVVYSLIEERVRRDSSSAHSD
jgi:Na+/melibiose symporter-like transporter